MDLQELVNDLMTEPALTGKMVTVDMGLIRNLLDEIQRQQHIINSQIKLLEEKANDNRNER